MRVRDVIEFSNLLNVIRYQQFENFVPVKTRMQIVNKIMSFFRDENLSKEMEE